MEIAKTFNNTEREKELYKQWIDKGFFKSTPDEREPYTIVIPPPNVTGVLHMGHMLNNTIQDVLVRKARMEGKNACWVPGTDHASIATEAKVVAMLKDMGIDKREIGREEFLRYAMEWKDKYGGIILEQLKTLGASCDWDRTSFTMDPGYYQAVIDVFIDLYNKGQIYRGTRMVNWDPKGLTAVSDEEVIHKEVNSKLYYVKYPIAEIEGEYITIATTRPETILGDTAVCVHPDDERYKHLAGKHAVIPMVNRKVPIIFDTYIDLEFGTGALKVTPAHDINDYNLGIKHNLEVIDTLEPNGTLSAAAGFYIGQDRFAVRKQIAIDLEALGLLVKVDDIKNKVGYSERTDAVIEPKLSMQWFLKMDTVSKPALENVVNGNVKLIPEKFINTYKHWMENVHDWCISRQLWWGHRIPAWYGPNNKHVVCKTAAEAVALFAAQGITVTEADLRQDEDVLDTWFSSWLWPIAVFDPTIFGKEDKTGNADLQYYYPTNDLVTAPEILFFWVARMIIAGYEYQGDKPFTNVYLTGIVRDKQGRKMSKSLGNSPDPLDLITQYGADGVRVGMLLSSPAGNDLLFDEGSCKQGSQFAHKLWNAFRLVKGWEIDATKTQSEASKTACNWFENRFNEEVANLSDLYSKYRISEVLMSVYKLAWDDFCSWYLEMVKPPFGEGIDPVTYNKTVELFEGLLKVLHPFMPFITEEIWQTLSERSENDYIIVAEYPKIIKTDAALSADFAVFEAIVTNVRNIRKEKNISPKEALELAVKGNKEGLSQSWFDLIIKLCNLSAINFVTESIQGMPSFLAGPFECIVPITIEVNTEEELKKLTADLDYTKGFLKSVQAKLANERFVANAKPEAVESERKKEADATAKIKLLEEQIGALQG